MSNEQETHAGILRGMKTWEARHYPCLNVLPSEYEAEIAPMREALVLKDREIMAARDVVTRLRQESDALKEPYIAALKRWSTKGRP